MFDISPMLKQSFGTSFATAKNGMFDINPEKDKKEYEEYLKKQKEQKKENLRRTGLTMAQYKELNKKFPQNYPMDEVE